MLNNHTQYILDRLQCNMLLTVGRFGAQLSILFCHSLTPRSKYLLSSHLLSPTLITFPNWKCLSFIYLMLLFGDARIKTFTDIAATVSLAAAASASVVAAAASLTAAAAVTLSYILSDTFSSLFPVLWLDWYVWCMVLQSDTASARCRLMLPPLLLMLVSWLHVSCHHFVKV